MKILFAMPVISLFAFLVAGCVQNSSLPLTVAARYGQLGLLHSGSLGASVELCRSGNESLYLVSGSGGFSGETYYYGEDGRPLGEYSWDDIREPGEPKPPIDISAYDCRMIEKSKN